MNYLRIICILIIILTNGCNDPEFEIRIIDIVNVELPDDGHLNTIIEIQATAQVNNGCYEDLDIKLDKVGDFNYRIKAMASYDLQAETCPQNLIKVIEVLTFKPEQTGEYYIEIYASASVIYNDTINIYQ